MKMTKCHGIEIRTKAAQRPIKPLLNDDVIFIGREKLLVPNSPEHAPDFLDAFVKVMNVRPSTNIPEVEWIFNAYVKRKHRCNHVQLYLPTSKPDMYRPHPV